MKPSRHLVRRIETVEEQLGEHRRCVTIEAAREKLAAAIERALERLRSGQPAPPLPPRPWSPVKERLAAMLERRLGP